MKTFHGYELTKEVRDFIATIIISIRKRLDELKVDGFEFIDKPVLNPKYMIREYLLARDEVYKVMTLHMDQIYWPLFISKKFGRGFKIINDHEIDIMPIYIAEFILEVYLDDLY